MSHDISRLQADVATSSNFFCSSLWGFVSLSPFLLSARRSVPHFPFVSPSLFRLVLLLLVFPSFYCSCIHSCLYHSYCPSSSPPSPVHAAAAECARANERTHHCYIITAICCLLVLLILLMACLWNVGSLRESIVGMYCEYLLSTFAHGVGDGISMEYRNGLLGASSHCTCLF